MFTAKNLQALLLARPFVPFRLALSDGGAVNVPSRELVIVGRQFAVIGVLDPEAKDTLADFWTTVWYHHVARVEMLGPGAPPFQEGGQPGGAPAGAPAVS